MLDFKKKTYSDSYLYAEEADRHNRKLTEFILKSKRIDKNSDAFRGILEDVKRQQTSSILYDVLRMDNVILCINNVELPRAFKVFNAKDIRLGSGANAKNSVFIDVTGIIDLKDNYFYCKKIDVLITYLFDALAYLLYQNSTLKMINNSNISISGTECFVSLFDYIIDYLRIIGYAQNKDKISYLAGIYFLHNMMGKEIDSYTKNIAAKVAGISASNTKAYELYYTEKDFESIYSFINLIAETFKLKGLTPEVFIYKWMYLYQTGTQYAVELFTSFAVLIINAYCGSYIVHQKQIERCCGQSMIKFATSILKLGVDEFSNRFNENATEEFKRDKASMDLADSLNRRSELENDIKFNEDDFESEEKIMNKMNSIIKFYKDSKNPIKISKKITESILYLLSKSDNPENLKIVESILEKNSKYLDTIDADNIRSKINSKISENQESMINNRETDKEKATDNANQIIALRKCVNKL